MASPPSWLVRSVRARRRVVLLTAVASALPTITAACSNSESPPVAPLVKSDPLLGAGFPNVPLDALVYTGPDSLYAGRASRIVLHADRTFALQFAGLWTRPSEYKGSYERADSLLTFTFDGWGTGPRWAAIGTLRGDSLRLSYNIAAQLSDFLDGTYVR